MIKNNLFKTYASLLSLFAILTLSSCAEAIRSAQDTVQSTADGIEASTERLEGELDKSLEKKSPCNIELSEEVEGLPISFGSCRMKGASSSNNHILSIYINFVDKVNRELKVAVYDEDGKLKGNTSLRISGEDGDNDFYQFIFNDDINITTYDKIIIE